MQVADFTTNAHGVFPNSELKYECLLEKKGKKKQTCIHKRDLE